MVAALGQFFGRNGKEEISNQQNILVKGTITVSFFFFKPCSLGELCFMHNYIINLLNETSPYLLQHAHNPVNWYPWGDEALQKAKEENKPILVSIGYAACHWCHVMERESFEDEAHGRINE